MKKTTKNSKVLELMHELYEEAKEYVERGELGAYIGKHNDPKVGMMDESQDIGAQDVLMLGSYMTLRKLVHTAEEPESKADIQVQVIGSSKEFSKLPKEVREALIKALEGVDDEPKKGKK